eukprot:scaffold1159_cov160-Ochromonas_danica.AAC.18
MSIFDEQSDGISIVNGNGQSKLSQIHACEEEHVVTNRHRVAMNTARIVPFSLSLIPLFQARETLCTQRESSLCVHCALGAQVERVQEAQAQTAKESNSSTRLNWSFHRTKQSTQTLPLLRLVVFIFISFLVHHRIHPVIQNPLHNP